VARLPHLLSHKGKVVKNMSVTMRISTAARSIIFFILTCSAATFQVPRPLTQSAKSSSTALYSLNKLVDELVDSKNPRTVFVAGKGGVGKTTVSSALAVSLASSYENDLKVLVVSTDPAHSLGDALDEDLRKGLGKPLVMTDPLTSGRLYACEVDAGAALQNFRESLSAFDMNRLADALGVSPDFLESFGLREFSGLLNNPPPGLDELVALSNVLDNPNVGADFDVVIVDTAPTGHTLRLLALPQFLDSFLGKLIKLRMKLAGLASTLQALFGSSDAQQRAKTIDTAVNKLEEFRVKMSNLRTRLKDSSQTNFVVVSVPTKLSVLESKRLMDELTNQGISVTDVVLNQCVEGASGGETSEAMKNYYERRKAGQNRWIQELTEATNKVSTSTEYKENGGSGPIAVTTVPFFDVELVGVPALAYLGRECLIDNPNFKHLMSTDDAMEKDPRVVICGGKGGVGKTTTSAALAISMAAQGHNVALISTDPAHSLGDAVDLNLSGGALQDCPLLGVPASEGSLSVLEVDPSQSLSQFKNVIDQLLGTEDNPQSSSELVNSLQEFGDIFDTLPAGTDEVVALAKVINLVKKGRFDRIVLDTAPTGHTLRMLSTPGFLAELIDRVLILAEKVNSNAAIKMLISSAAGGRQEEMRSTFSSAKSTLLNFQLQMYDLEDMFANADQTEFLIVTVPTELAVRESVRLLNDLTFEAPDMPIKVRNVVINQVLKDDGTDIGTFLSRVHDGQEASISELKSAASKLPKPPEVTEVQYLDTEPRGVFGLKVLADALTRED
jgi:arsenite-transporting ATPase